MLLQYSYHFICHQKISVRNKILSYTIHFSLFSLFIFIFFLEEYIPRMLLFQYVFLYIIFRLYGYYIIHNMWSQILKLSQHRIKLLKDQILKLQNQAEKFLVY